MEGKSNSSRLSTKTSQVLVQPLDDSKIRNLLHSLQDVVKSALGPSGRLKFFQTSGGGHVTVTSTSSKILHSLSGLSHPISRLILSAVRGHLDTYNDGGLRTALLMLSLIQSAIDMPIPRVLVTEIFEHSLQVLSDHLQSCVWKMKVDVGHMKSMMSVVNSIVGTKPACHLSESEKQYITVLLIKAFLHSLPSKTSKDSSCPVLTPLPVQIVTCEGDPVNESKILQGVLLQAPNIPSFRRSKTLISHPTKVALYNVSMAGDTDEWFGNSVKTEATIFGHDSNIESAVLGQMLKVADWLIDTGVAVVACQKCVHPIVKQYLQDKGAFVIDRVSIVHITAVQRLTGATTLSTFTLDIPVSNFGQLERIDHVVINDKSYIHLFSQPSSQSSPVCTLQLCSPNETFLEELKLVCQASIIALHETLKQPYVVPGAGCLDTHLALMLRMYGSKCSSEKSRDFGCSKGQFMSVINNVALCLESQAKDLEHDGGSDIIDSANHHHWSLPPGALELKPSMPHCMCGLVSHDHSLEWSMMGDAADTLFGDRDMCCAGNSSKIFENVVLDIYSMKMNSYKIAFETANAILRIQSVVCSSVV